MHAYLAESGTLQYRGSLGASLAWAATCVASNRSRIIKVFRARPDEKHMRIVAEITATGVRFIEGGRFTKMRRSDRDG